jgi:poly(A) polymerase
MPSVHTGVEPPPQPLPDGEGLSAREEGAKHARALAYRLGMEQALDRLLLTSTDIAPLIGWSIPSFPLKGGEIVARGVKAGPEVARILQAVEAQWVAEAFPEDGRVWELLGKEMSK